MTGVVSDNMLSVREEQDAKDEAAQEARRALVEKVLGEIFTAADKDGSGSLMRAEYMDILHSDYHIKKLQTVASVSVKDFESSAFRLHWTRLDDVLD